MAIETLKAEVNLMEGVKVECSSRGFQLTLDQSKEAGGTNEGMCPGEALLSSLGGCKCMVARLQSKVLDIKLESLRIELEGEIDSDGFKGKNKDAKIGFSKITTKYYITANNTKDQIKNYIEKVESTCPIKDTIVNAPEMDYEINIK